MSTRASREEITDLFDRFIRPKPQRTKKRRRERRGSGTSSTAATELRPLGSPSSTAASAASAAAAAAAAAAAVVVPAAAVVVPTAAAAAVHAAAKAKGFFVDGSRGEGGGQVIRNACAYACILKQPLEITKIRAGRSKPGLKAQHLTGLQLVAQICDGHLHGGELNSTAIKLLPGAAGTGSSSRGGGAFTGDTKTAGSICLLLQAALPCALFAGGPCTLELKGGTNAEMAPQYDYFEHVFLPIASKFGFTAKPEVEARGYFPRGGGVVKLGVDPVVGKLKAITLTDRGHVTHVKIRAFHAGKVPQKVATTMAETAEAMVRADFFKLSLNLRRTLGACFSFAPA